MAKKPRVNSISRFSKRSPRLVMESHGSCEVPAGCGGVVLRWRNPNVAAPLTLVLYTPGEALLWLDGVPLTTGRLLLPHGRHVLAIVLSELPYEQGALRFAASNAGLRRSPTATATPSVFTRVLSAPDGTWLYTTREPPDDSWQTLDWDSAAWLSLVTAHQTEPADADPGAWAFRNAREMGGRGIGPEEPAERLWIRKEFRVLPEEPVPRPREDA